MVGLSEFPVPKKKVLKLVILLLEDRQMDKNREYSLEININEALKKILK